MNFALYPLAFYVTLIIWALAVAYAATGLRQAWGVPAIVVLLTVGGWYIGDALYNNYEEYFWEFGTDTLDNAWWQVGGFVLAFAAMVKPVNAWMNRKVAGEESFAMRMYEGRLRDEDTVQLRIDQAAKALMILWVVLTVIGLFRVDWDVVGVFLPFVKGHTVNPWGRGQIGGGFDAVLSLVGYVQMFLTATFGVIWAVSKNPRTRSLAGLIFLLAVPTHLFDRTRNAMLAVVVPGALAWAVLRLRTSWLMRSVVLIGMFAAINFWMLFVMSKRGEMTIAAAVQQEDAFASVEEAKHEGLSMFSELAWINHFIKLGIYEPNWGHRYFAEVANIVPRALWPGKPTIGLDYSVLRGQVQDEATGMVTATVSTGMIGQGVVNFGLILGPLFAAWLMALWVALLARQDLMAEEHPSRFLLYAMGIILTFNMGRDITPLVAYPFFFGYALVYYLERRRAPAARAGTKGQPEVGDRRSETGTEDGPKANRSPRRPTDQGTKGQPEGGVRSSEVGVAGSRDERVKGGNVGAGVRYGGRRQREAKPGATWEGGEETQDERRDVGTGGMVRTLPIRTPKRIARWMPRRVRQQVAAEQRAAADQGTKGLKDEGTNTANGDVKGEELRVAGKGERPRQLSVPFRNYRRYRGG